MHIHDFIPLSFFFLFLSLPLSFFRITDKREYLELPNINIAKIAWVGKFFQNTSLRLVIAQFLAAWAA